MYSEVGIGLVLVVIVFTGVLLLQPPLTGHTLSPAQNSECVVAFQDGGGPYYIADVPYREHLSPPGAIGQPLSIRGRILYSDCSTVAQHAVLNVWQADETGEYDQEWYRGLVTTDENGEYSFQTIAPKGYGEGTGYRPPHIHYKVFVEGREIITSQMFFPDVQGRFDDNVIIQFPAASADVLEGFFTIIIPEDQESGR